MHHWKRTKKNIKRTTYAPDDMCFMTINSKEPIRLFHCMWSLVGVFEFWRVFFIRRKNTYMLTIYTSLYCRVTICRFPFLFPSHTNAHLLTLSLLLPPPPTQPPLPFKFPLPASLSPLFLVSCLFLCLCSSLSLSSGKNKRTLGRPKVNSFIN